MNYRRQIRMVRPVERTALLQLRALAMVCARIRVSAFVRVTGRGQVALRVHVRTVARVFPPVAHVSARFVRSFVFHNRSGCTIDVSLFVYHANTTERLFWTSMHHSRAYTCRIRYLLIAGSCVFF